MSPHPGVTTVGRWRNSIFEIEYQYKDERGILVPVALRYAGRETGFFARVDTGASFCIFQRLHAETLGMWWTQAPRCGFPP